MQKFIIIIIFVFLNINVLFASDGAKCQAPDIGFDKIIGIVDKERSIHTELPVPLKDAAIWIERTRCFYTYREAPKKQQLDFVGREFIINQFGKLVNVTDGNLFQNKLNCLNKDPTIEQIQLSLEKERGIDSSIPKSPEESKTILLKNGCMYDYWETPLPEIKGRYNIYTFDYNGDLYDFKVVGNK